MRTVVTKLPSRTKLSLNRQEGILNADTDNAYYQRMELLYRSSGALQRSVRTMAKFVRGKGYTDERIGKLVINRKGWTMNQLHAKRVNDYAKCGGFALQFNYNELCQIKEINFVPFKYCRICVDKEEVPTGEIAIYEDWGNLRWSKTKRDKIYKCHLFNPDPNIILKQVEEAGGWLKYNGQILWYSPEVDTYPLAFFDAEAESAETDFRIKRWKLKNVSTAFLASYMCIAKGKRTKEQEDEFIKSIEQFQGDDNTGKVVTIFAEREESIPTLTKFDTQNNDTLFSWTNSDTYERLRKIFGIPAILAGELSPGKLGSARDYMDAVNIYNNLTQEDREAFTETDQSILAYWQDPIDADVKYEISPLSSFTPIDIPSDLYKDMSHQERRNLANLPPDEDGPDSAVDSLAMSLGARGAQDLIVLLQSTLPDEMKVQTLIEVFSIPEPKARKMVQPVPAPPPGSSNPPA